MAVFPGVPPVAGFPTRAIGELRMGRERSESVVPPGIGPWALYGPLFTIVVLFAPRGGTITEHPLVGTRSPPTAGGVGRRPRRCRPPGGQWTASSRPMAATTDGSTR